jgi:hypothetical protein
VGQLGSADYARPRRFRERLERWLDLVRVLWPRCPAQISSDGYVGSQKFCHLTGKAASFTA